MQSPVCNASLEPGGFYHLYNRGNNYQNVFLTSADYQLFLGKWRQFIHPVAKTLAYSLLPNHFHALLQIRDIQDLASPEGRLVKSRLPAEYVIQRAFTNFFISYARTLQNNHGFHGAVFHSPFKRKRVGDEFYLDHLMAYIHYNALKHGIFKGALHEYPYSSYRALVSTAPTRLERDFVLDYFGGLDRFIAYHESRSSYFELREELEP